jgi:phosphatidylinositol kinase/protein kinase (PI-3  family)
VTVTADKSDSATSSSHRTPSIHFLGKSGWQALKTEKQQHTTEKQQPIAIEKSNPFNPLAINVIYDNSIDSTYGRPKFTEAEMEALIMGGASIAPNVVSMSKGASFSP